MPKLYKAKNCKLSRSLDFKIQKSILERANHISWNILRKSFYNEVSTGPKYTSEFIQISIAIHLRIFFKILTEVI